MAKSDTKSLLKGRSKKKPRAKTIATVDLLKMYGHNPIYEGKGLEDPKYNIQFQKALSWCGTGLDHKELQKELVAWMEITDYDKLDIKAVKACPDAYCILDGKISYLINNKWPIEDSMLERMTVRISALITKGNNAIEVKKEENKEKDAEDNLKKDNKESSEVLNFREAQEIADEIEDSIILTGKMDMTRVSVISKGKKANVLNNSIGMIKDIITELNLIGEDDQVTEAYSFLNGPKTKKLIKFFNDSINIIEGESINKRAVRRPKTAKAKSAAVQVKGFKWKRSDKTYNLESIEPINMIGMSKMVIFNTKYRKIGIYYANDASGFTCKGTTLQNFDESISEEKTLRNTKDKKISDWVLEFRKATVKKVDKIFIDIKTTNTKMKGRFNNEIIILKVFK